MNRRSPQRSRNSLPRNTQKVPPECPNLVWTDLGPCFRHRHQLVFSWLLVLHLVYGERANLGSVLDLDFH
jgi:hypothetical protein